MANEVLPLFVVVGNALDSATATYVVDNVTRLIQVIKPWALASITLYITFFGYMVLSGRIQAPLEEGLMKGVKIVFICAIALNADLYLDWIVQTIESFKTSMVSAVIGQEGLTPWESLDQALDKGFGLFQFCMTRAADSGVMEMGTMCLWLLAGLMIGLSFTLIVICGASVIFIASALLKVVFALGPFFLLCLCFEATRSWFIGWLEKIASLIFQVVCVSALLAMSLKIYGQIVSSIDLGAVENQSVLKCALMLQGTAMLLYWCMLEAGRLAGDLGGRAAVEAMSLAGIKHHATAPGRAAKQAINPTSTRSDPSTGRQITASRAEHLIAGRSFAVPAYRRHVLENIRNGWKK